MIDLIENQAMTYSYHDAANRLTQVGMTESSYRRLRTSRHEQTIRESAIPDGDVEAAVQFLIKHPDVGAGKAYASLVDQEEAWLSTASINTVKQELIQMVELEYKKRKETEKLLEAQLRQDLLARKKKNDYLHLQATFPNHIWAIDFVNIRFLSMPFVLCVVYDEYSQDYLSLRVGFWADHELAATSLQEALRQIPKGPVFVRRDNGKPFLTHEFQQHLKEAQDYPTPPHSPWYNGSLESCNTSLKTAVKSTGMQDMADNPSPFRDAREDPDIALDTLQCLVDRVRVMLNQEISRRKHNMPPEKVLLGQKQPTQARHRAFINKKKQERCARMANIHANPHGRHAPKTLLANAQSIIKRTLGHFNTNALYVLDEVLHQRFRMFET